VLFTVALTSLALAVVVLTFAALICGVVTVTALIGAGFAVVAVTVAELPIVSRKVGTVCNAFIPKSPTGMFCGWPSNELR